MDHVFYLLPKRRRQEGEFIPVCFVRHAQEIQNGSPIPVPIGYQPGRCIKKASDFENYMGTVLPRKVNQQQLPTSPQLRIFTSGANQYLKLMAKWPVSIVATNFRSTDVLQPPIIPCLFPDSSPENPTNVDLFGQPFTSSSSQPPFVTGAISTFCRTAVLLSEVLTYGQVHRDNEDTNFGDRANLIKRKEFLANLNAIGNSLPSALRHDHNFTPATCFLR